MLLVQIGKPELKAAEFSSVIIEMCVCDYKD